MNQRPTNPRTNSTVQATLTAGANSAEIQQIQQRLWVKDQELTALKVQNRHLISKLEEAEKKAEPNQINTQLLANEIKSQLEPLVAEIQKSLTESFEILKGTMRGIYQQSQRAEKAVEDIGAHSRDVERRMQEQRKADQVYYQEKIFSIVTSFGERIERQLENRLRNLAVVELMNTKQNEVLSDIETLKNGVSQLILSYEGLRGEIRNDTRKTSPVAVADLEKLIEKVQESGNLKRQAIEETKIHEERLVRNSQEIKSSVKLDCL